MNTPALANLALTSATDFASQFAGQRDTLPGAHLRHITHHRDAAMRDFAGLPSRRVEDWKFTGLEPLAKLAFQPSDHGRDGIEALLDDMMVEGIEARLVLVNGRYRHDLSVLPQDDRVRTASLADALEGDAVSAADLPSGPTSGQRGRALGALNAALVRDGVVIHVLAGTEAGAVQIVHIADPGSEAAASHVGLVVKLESGARMTLVESWIGVPGTHWSNIAVRVHLGTGAALDHVKLQREAADSFHTALLRAHLGATAKYRRIGVALGGSLARDELDISLDGEGAEADLNGIAIALDRQLLDHSLRVIHAAPGCNSNQLYKHVADGEGHTVFQGRISVAVDAQKSDAQQLNNNLLLSDGAEADTKPELEILADDVKCSHGATVGDLDANALFYLKARGIGAREARHLLVEAFALAPLEKIEAEAVRTFIETELRRKLEATDHD